MKLLLLTLAICLGVIAARGEHPRLYFNSKELIELRRLRTEPGHAKIWSNIVESAEWCLTKTPRTNWIAPVTPDPIYENLYDRFFAIMGDLAITEHLSFAYALTGEKRYGDAARQWTLASCRAWQREAEGQPDSGKGYAVSRLLKGIALGYDMAFDRFTEAERNEIRGTLERIGKTYYEKYFSTPTISGPTFHTHHAIVEWSSFGVVGLTLLGETPDAKKWVDATVKKFEDHLLPTGLADDGAQVEGATFWASTMHYRFFFMDALRHVTGKDLFPKYKNVMHAELALASVASEHWPGYAHDNDDTVLETYYGQLDYYSPVLVMLAREYRRPIYQHLVHWDHTLGSIQKTRAITPHMGEPLVFTLGAYAYCWYDASVPDRVEEERLSYHFKSIGEAYLRASFEPGDLLVGVSKDRIVVHAGGIPVLVAMNVGEKTLPDLQIASVSDTNGIAILKGNKGTNAFTFELDRREHSLRISRTGNDEWQWYSPHKLTQNGKALAWGQRAALKIEKGNITSVEPDAYSPRFATGFNKLTLKDPAPQKLSRVTLSSDKGEMTFVIRSQK